MVCQLDQAQFVARYIALASIDPRLALSCDEGSKDRRVAVALRGREMSNLKRLAPLQIASSFWCLAPIHPCHALLVSATMTHFICEEELEKFICINRMFERLHMYCHAPGGGPSAFLYRLHWATSAHHNLHGRCKCAWLACHASLHSCSLRWCRPCICTGESAFLPRFCTAKPSSCVLKAFCSKSADVWIRAFWQRKTDR